MQIGFCSNKQQNPAAQILLRCWDGFTAAKEADSLLFPTRDQMCGYFYKMDIKHRKRIRKKHHWPPESGTFSTLLAQTRNGGVTKWQGHHSLLSPVTKCTLFLPALPKPRDLTGNSCSWAQSASKGSQPNPSAFPSRNWSSLGSQSCGWSPEEPGTIFLSWQTITHPVLFTTAEGIQNKFSLEMLPAVQWQNMCACMHMCVHVHVWVVRGIVLKLHFIFSA